MTKITIELTEEEDKQLKHILVDKSMPKAKYIEQIFKEHLKYMEAQPI